MSRSALSKAWRWSVVRSPVLNLWRRVRYMGYPNHIAFDLLDEAGLPGEADALIRTTLKRSKLWANERGEIARELISHTQDAIEAGRTGEEIAETFGDPKRIAKLMRRSMKRKRPLYWRAYRNMKRATGVMVLVLIVGYGSLAARFYMGKPSIKRNYIAELNARNDGYSEDQKAWGVYQEADIAWQRLVLEQWYQYRAQEDGGEQGQAKLSRNTFLNQISSSINEYQPGDPEYLRTVGLVRDFAPELVKIREAAMRPIVGLLYTDRNESVEIEDGVFELKLLEPNADPREQDLVISVLLPDLVITRRYANLLVFDAKLAIEDRDTQRAEENYLAIAGIARQDLRQGFIISELVGMAILDLGATSFHQSILEQPDMWNSDQLVSIAHAYAQAGREINLDLSFERMAFDDVLQRLYTDDGAGNGRLTPQGSALLASKLISVTEFGQSEDQVDDRIQLAMDPLKIIGAESREQQRRRYHSVMDGAERVIREGPESLWRLQLIESQIEDRYARAEESLFGHSPVDVMTPAMRSAVIRYFQGRLKNSAFLTMLAIETYRRDTGRLPDSLDQVTPQYIPAIPQDLFNPGHPIQYKFDDAGYILYVAGSDGDLDDGMEPDPKDPARMDLSRRFRVNIFRVSGPFGSGSSEVARDANGRPILLEPDAPDSDWILIDMRQALESPSDD
jgi:HAAS